MPIVITNVTHINTKAGVKYAIVHGISEKGEAVTAFLTADQFEQFGITDKVIATTQQLKQIFDELPQVDVIYNARGRVENIKV